jgi:hypothetical protein
MSMIEDTNALRAQLLLEDAGMELMEGFLNGLAEVWPAISQAPMPFALLGIAIFLLGYAVGGWYYRTEVRVLKALGGVLEQRIKDHEQENARLLALLEPTTRAAFSAIHSAPSHKLDVPYSLAQIAARPEYSRLLDLGMIKIEQMAPDQTSLCSTSAASKLWEAMKQK